MDKIDSIGNGQEDLVTLSEEIITKDVFSLSFEKAEKEYKCITRRINRLFKEFVVIKGELDRMSERSKVNLDIGRKFMLLSKNNEMVLIYVNNRFDMNKAINDLQNLKMTIGLNANSSTQKEQKRFVTLYGKCLNFCQKLDKKIKAIPV